MARVWHAFRRWRRSRPFWGGLLLALAGLEIFATTQMRLAGLTFQLGPTGFLSWLIPTILVACGLLLWFTPQHRMFYAIVAAVTAVYSLIAVNLGGFFVGLLLGMVGSALGFAWTPLAQPSATDEMAAEDEAAAEGDGPDEGLALVAGSESTLDRAEDAPADRLPQPRSPLAEQTDPRTNPPLAAILVITLGLASVAVAAQATPAQADPCPPAAAPTESSSEPAAEPAAEGQEPGEEQDGNLLTDIVNGVVNGVVNLLGGGDDGEEETASAATAPGASPSPTADPEPSDEPAPAPTGCGEEAGEGSEGTGKGREKAKADEGALPEGVKLLDAPPGHPRVAKTPSLLTGSRLTIRNLRFDGIVDLPTVDGTIRVLQFSMDRAVTKDFRLQVSGPESKTTNFTSDTLTVSGDVKFYASRFTARLLGIKITLTPESPLPPNGIPLTVPIAVFDDPKIDLVFVDCNRLTAKPTLALDLR